MLPWTRNSQPPDAGVRYAAAEPAASEPGAIQQTSATIIEAPFKAISSGLKTGAEKVSEAFAPPVRKADDPTSLSTKTTPNSQLYLAMARLAEQEGRFDEADQRYRQALEGAPDDLNVLVAYARMKDRQGDMDAAVEIYRRAAKAHRDNAMVHNDLGLCLARRKQLPESLASLQKAVELDGKQVLYRNNIATVLVEMGNVDAAYAQLAAVHPPAAAYYNVGYLLYKKGRPEEAAALFAQALKVDPSFHQARIWLTRISAPESSAGSTPLTRAPGDGRLEDPTVEAPDLRALRRPVVTPGRRTPTIYGPSPDGVRAIPSPEGGPMPRISTPQAMASKPLLPRLRQLPPVLESSRQSATVVPQSWEDAPLPPEITSGGRRKESLQAPPAFERDPAKEEAEATDAPAAASSEDGPPAPLPDDAAEAAAPLP